MNTYVYNRVQRVTLTVQEGAVLGTQRENLEVAGGKALNVLLKIFNAFLAHCGGTLLNVTHADSWGLLLHEYASSVSTFIYSPLLFIFYQTPHQFGPMLGRP